MALVEKSVLIEHSAQEMFDLVDRVEDYPAFLPWCGGTELIRRDEEVTAATIRIDYRGVKSSFSTENAKKIPHLMEIRLREGPFRALEGSWRFTPLGERACKVEFRLRYEFSSALLEKLVGAVFSHIVNSFVEAFVQRANQVYGMGEKA